MAEIALLNIASVSRTPDLPTSEEIEPDLLNTGRVSRTGSLQIRSSGIGQYRMAIVQIEQIRTLTIASTSWFTLPNACLESLLAEPQSLIHRTRRVDNDYIRIHR